MKLKDFPLILAGYRAIQQDQPIAGQALNKEADVSGELLTSFKLAEEALNLIPKNATLNQIGSRHLPSLKPDWDVMKDDLVIDQVYVPTDDADREILRYYKASPQQINAVQDVLTEFFDGPLRVKFEVRIKGTLGAQGATTKKLFEIVDKNDPRIYR